MTLDKLVEIAKENGVKGSDKIENIAFGLPDHANWFSTSDNEFSLDEDSDQ